jgi:response regulator of citrate/malate metabolism
MNIARIVLVDDDQIFNFIHQKVIEQLATSIPVYTFQSSQDALTFFEEMKTTNDRNKTVVFLDINMPFFNGFEVLNKLINEGVSSENLLFYVVSSTLNEKEIERALSYDMVKGFYSKPLTKEIITEILTEK